MLMLLLMPTFFAHQTFAATKEEKFAEKVKTEIFKLGTGTDAKIKIKLKDGRKLKGYVIEAGESQFIIMDSKTGQTLPIAYPQVGQVKGNNLSSGVVIAIGVVAALIFIIIVGNSLK